MHSTLVVEAALNAEMEEHLGNEKHKPSKSQNSRNGKSTKRVKTKDGNLNSIPLATVLDLLTPS
jgi:transposase-like protein